MNSKVFNIFNVYSVAFNIHQMLKFFYFCLIKVPACSFLCHSKITLVFDISFALPISCFIHLTYYLLLTIKKMKILISFYYPYVNRKYYHSLRIFYNTDHFNPTLTNCSACVSILFGLGVMVNYSNASFGNFQEGHRGNFQAQTLMVLFRISDTQGQCFHLGPSHQLWGKRNPI